MRLSRVSRASLEGASARAGIAASSHPQLGSRAAHFTAKAMSDRLAFRGCRWSGPPGVRGAARTQGLGRNRRGPSAQPRQQRPSYKPVVKSTGAQRESDGVVVPAVASQAAGGKGPDFGHVGDGGKREGMAGTARSNYPEGRHVAPPKCDNSRTGYGLRPSSLRVAASTPSTTASTGVTSCARRGTR